jgi:hypothetical protein
MSRSPHGFQSLLAAACLFATCLFASSPARAQTDTQMLLNPWPQKVWGETVDHFIFEAESDIRNAPESAQIFWWDSVGRFRLDTSRDDALHIGYRYVTIDFDTNSDAIPNHLDEVSVAAGFTLGEWKSGRVSAILGAGWSGDNPFADAGGIFGIGHLLWQKQLDTGDVFVVSLDYNGVSSLLPDVPLPGFAFIRKQNDSMTWQFGFPRSSVTWEFAPRWLLDASYEVPYTGLAEVQYRLSKHWQLFGQAANFFEGFRLDDEPSSHRTFFQMSRVESGIRYVNADFVWKGIYFDAALSVGYAFEQKFSSGHDVRDLDPQAELSDAPFVGLFLRGRF